MRSARPARVALTLLLATTLGACTEIDNMLARVPFFAFMRNSPGFDPYEAPRLPPENSVAFEGPTGQVPAPIEASQAGLQAFGDANANPIPRGEASEERGRTMFERYCAICHGPAGMGGNTGTVTSTGVYPPIVPPVAAGRATTLSDGYIYAIIRVGRGLMPAYAVQVPHEDRWHIVNYLRSLQEGGAPAAGDGAAEAGAAGEGDAADGIAAGVDQDARGAVAPAGAADGSGSEG
jgi:mono/diheme cytochrome c family protein